MIRDGIYGYMSDAEKTPTNFVIVENGMAQECSVKWSGDYAEWEQWCKKADDAIDVTDYFCLTDMIADVSHLSWTPRVTYDEWDDGFITNAMKNGELIQYCLDSGFIH